MKTLAERADSIAADFAEVTRASDELLALTDDALRIRDALAERQQRGEDVTADLERYGQIVAEACRCRAAIEGLHNRTRAAQAQLEAEAGCGPAPVQRGGTITFENKTVTTV